MGQPFIKSFVSFGLFLCFASWGFSQEPVGPTQEEIENNTQELVLKVRDGMAKKQYSDVFSILSSQMNNNSSPIVKTWFFYVMWAEVGKLTGGLSSIVSHLPSKGGFRVFSKALTLWDAGDALSSARLLASIAPKDPSLEYLVGKLYFSVGKLYQGAGYLYLGAEMSQAPYGLYYAGLGQNSVGQFSKAHSFLSDAQSALLPSEQDLLLKIRLQQAVAQFGRGNYDDAYKIILEVYEADPVSALETLDPGIVLTAMDKNVEARDFWNQALKKRLPYAISAQIRKNLSYNRRLTDPNYPPAWQRH